MQDWCWHDHGQRERKEDNETRGFVCESQHCEPWTRPRSSASRVTRVLSAPAFRDRCRVRGQGNQRFTRTTTFARQADDCRRRLVDAVVVYRYDRFARSLRQLVLALEEFRALGIDFISLHEGVDTSTPNGRLVFGIFASIAEFERELIRDRVRSGLAAARAKGKRIGRPRVPVDALRIGFLRHQGRSWAQIKADTGISKGTAQRALASLPRTPVATASPSA